ncbi:MAG: hypothetical protein N2Z81_01555 [Hydrogenothermaceae bacterium]|nr:hypothetical protein [Hydrogenothermaceae bacterium]
MDEFKVEQILNIRPISDETPGKREFLKKKKKKEEKEEKPANNQKKEEGHIDIYV